MNYKPRDFVTMAVVVAGGLLAPLVIGAPYTVWTVPVAVACAFVCWGVQFLVDTFFRIWR